MDLDQERRLLSRRQPELLAQTGRCLWSVKEDLAYLQHACKECLQDMSNIYLSWRHPSATKGPGVIIA